MSSSANTRWHKDLPTLLRAFAEVAAQRTDVRLVLASILTLVAGATAYLVTSGRVDDQVLDRAADYWPLLLAVIGVGLLPLAFRRRAG